MQTRFLAAVIFLAAVGSGLVSSPAQINFAVLFASSLRRTRTLWGEGSAGGFPGAGVPN